MSIVCSLRYHDVAYLPLLSLCVVVPCDTTIFSQWSQMYVVPFRWNDNQ